MSIKYKITGDVVELTAGENLQYGDYVFLAHETAPYTFIDGITPGQVYKTRKDVRARGVNAICLGFIVSTSVAAGSSVQVKISGRIAWPIAADAGVYYRPSVDPGNIELYSPAYQAQENPVAFGILFGTLNVLKQSYSLRGRAYCMAGASGSNINTVSAFTFSTEAEKNLTVTTTVSRNASASGSVSSYTKGYCIGGWTSASVTTVDALTYSTETVSATSSLTTGTCNAVGAFMPSKAIFMGGYTTTPVNTVMLQPFSTETWSSGSNLPANHDTCGGGVSGTKAYVAGGTSATYSNVICGYTLSSGTSANLSATLTGNRNTMAGMPSRTKLYLGGGGLSGWEPSSYTNQVDSLEFSTETCTSLTTLTSSRAFIRGGSSSIGGYAFGGLNALTSIDKISLSSETCSSLGSTATSRRGYACNTC